MKAYFGMNDHIYKDDKTVMLVFLNKMSKGRGGTFAKGWYIKLVNTAIPDLERHSKNYVTPLRKPSSQRISRIEPTRWSTP